MKNRTTDMTVGSPLKHLLLFSLPLFAGNLIQQLYNLVDSIVLGKFVGASALAATGACGSLNFFFFSLGNGLANGIGIIVAQYFGAKNEKKVRASIANSFYILTVMGLLTSLLGVLLARPLLLLMSTPEDILNDAVIYLRTTCCGTIFICMYNCVAAILRALGDSKTPLYFLIFSCIANIVMDLLFVVVFKMAVFGTAIATVIAQAMSVSVSLIYAFAKVPYFKLTREEMKPDKKIIRESFRLGIPMALQSCMISISTIILQTVVNTFGTIVIAAYTITCKIDNLTSQFYGAAFNALVTYSGQNVGAGNKERVKQGFWHGTLLICAYNLIWIPIVYLCSRYLVGMFVTAADADVITMGIKAQRICGIFYIALGMIYVPRGLLNGAGDAAFSLINGITEVLCRIVYAFALTRIASIGYWGIWYATGLTWTTVAIVCAVRFWSGRWKKKIVVRT